MISVLMLTYNREKLVSRAIESILAQTYRDFEFVIVDNGSSDESGKIADEYAKSDSRIRVFHRERGSISAGRNTALDAARGDYIAFIDDDDWAEPDFLEFLLKLIEENDADISICGAADKAFDEKKIMTAEEALIELMWRKKYNVGFPTKLIKRELVGEMRFPEDACYDDIALMYKVMASANRVAYHGLPKYTVYRHEGNNSAWTTDHSKLNPATLEEYLNAYRVRTEWLSERFPNSAAAFRYFEWSFMISMVEKISRLKLRDCYKIRGELVKTLLREKDNFYNSIYIQDFEKKWMDDYMNDFTLNKLTIIITTRCNLRCKLCCEYVPQNTSFSDIAIGECASILEKLFATVDHINTLHLSGGGEPFLHPNLAELTELCMRYEDRFDRFMLFTNGTVIPNEKLLSVLKKYGSRIVVQVSRYGVNPDREIQVLDALKETGVTLKVEKYYGDDQSFGGWVDFGAWDKQGCPSELLQKRFENCAVTRDMGGNWRTRDGKVHWCSRSQRGMDLGKIPDFPEDYVDLFDSSSKEEKQAKFVAISKRSLMACDYCSGDAGTSDTNKRFKAAEQMEAK